MGFGGSNNKVLPHDFSISDLKSRGIRQKQCTNPGFILSYVVFLSIVSSISWYSFTQCNVAYFLNGIDSWGNICGANLGSALQIEGFEEYAKDKAHHSYLWRIVCNGSDIRICKKDCSPVVPSNTSSCVTLLEQNGYNDNQIAVSYCLKECLTNNETGDTRTVLNRCVSTESTTSHYQVIPGFLEFLHYAMEDIKNCFAVGGSIFSILFIGCIIMNVVFLLFAKQAMIICFATSVFITVSRTVYVALSISHSSQHFVTEWMYAGMDTARFLLSSTISLYCFIGVITAVGFVVNIIGIIWMMKYRKHVTGLLKISSKLVKSNPQLLSQPILSLFVIVIATAYFVVIMLLLLGSRAVNVSSSTTTVNLELSDFVWLLIPAALTFVWFIDLIEKGQNAILAGGASKWYFTRRFNLTFYPMSAVLKYNMGGVAAMTVANIFSKCKHSCPVYQNYISNYATISLGVYGRIQQTFLDQTHDDKFPTPLKNACTAIHFALLAWKIGLVQISTIAFTAFTSQISMYTSLIPTIVNAVISWKLISLFIAGLESLILGLAMSVHEDCLRNEMADTPKYCDSIIASLLHGKKNYLDVVSSKSANSIDSQETPFKSDLFSSQSTTNPPKNASQLTNYETASSGSDSQSRPTRYESKIWKKQQTKAGSDEDFKSLSSFDDDKKGEVKIIKTVKQASSVESRNTNWW